MPTKLSLTLDAAQYQQQLNKVVSNTRNAVKKMSENEVITQLTALANAAERSNTEQKKAVSLASQLSSQYGNLGVSVDKVSGKIKDSGVAIVGKENRISGNQEVQNVSDAGYNIGKTVKNINRLSIKTNDLTSRGGFQGSAVVPDADKYARQIAADNKSILTTLQRIESMVNEFGNF